MSLVSHEGGVEVTRVLRDAVQNAQAGVLRGGCDLASVNEMLAGLLADLAPVYDSLESIAVADPGGAVAAILEQLRLAFGHATRGQVDAAVSNLVTAAISTFRLAEVDELDAQVDSARWR